MIELLKEDTIIAKKIRAMEEFLRKNDIKITFRCDGLMVDVGNESYILVDSEALLTPELELPSCVDNRIRTVENYINE